MITTPFAEIAIFERVDRVTFDAEIKHGGKPAVLKGLAADWPAVLAARESPQALGAYLRGFDTGQMTDIAVCPKDQKGRFFYNEALTGLNYQTHKRGLSFILDWCLAQIGQPESEAVYLQAQPVAKLLPGMARELPMPLLDAGVTARIWLGNTLRTQTHFDYLSNIAVHVSGEKVFTLFPPDQTGNLYPGPLDVTPAGVPVSMASLEEPDFDRFPRLAEALEHAVTARLEPGDALFIPALWWHHVQTTGPLNMLVNYWWDDARPDLFNPIVALSAATMAFKEMPKAQRDAWRELIDYFVFEDKGDPVAHLPQSRQGLFRRDLSPQDYALFKQRMFGKT